MPVTVTLTKHLYMQVSQRNCPLHTHHITGTENYIKELVTALDRNVCLDGRNISMDHLYTSVSVTRWLLAGKMTIVGMLQMRQVGIPEEVMIKNREEFSTRVYWEKDGDMCITSFVVPTSKGVKNVMVLSTMRPLQGITRDDGKKAAIIKFYNCTKGGTDIVDQRIAKYITKMKSLKWTQVGLLYILDTHVSMH